MNKLIPVVLLMALMAACSTQAPPNTVIVGDIAGFVTAFIAVQGCDAANLVYTVQEAATLGAAAGTVSSTGVYTAPACGSAAIGTTVHVVATCANQSFQAPIAISETLTGLSMAAQIQSPGTAQACSLPITGTNVVLPGMSVATYSRINFTCHSVVVPALPSPVPAACP
jgi:hypothetical protein